MSLSEDRDVCCIFNLSCSVDEPHPTETDERNARLYDGSAEGGQQLLQKAELLKLPLEAQSLLGLLLDRINMWGSSQVARWVVPVTVNTVKLWMMRGGSMCVERFPFSQSLYPQFFADFPPSSDLEDLVLTGTVPWSNI